MKETNAFGVGLSTCWCVFGVCGVLVCVLFCLRCGVVCGVECCPRGPMDKASAYEAGDCGFESRRRLFSLHALTNYAVQ